MHKNGIAIELSELIITNIGGNAFSTNIQNITPP